MEWKYWATGNYEQLICESVLVVDLLYEAPLPVDFRLLNRAACRIPPTPKQGKQPFLLGGPSRGHRPCSQLGPWLWHVNGPLRPKLVPPCHTRAKAGAHRHGSTSRFHSGPEPVAHTVTRKLGTQSRCSQATGAQSQCPT